jgi:hypothetical protein
MNTPNPIIPPTIGRVVWFHPAPNSGEATFATHHADGVPYAAIVAHVWSPSLVNLTVLDANGVPHSRTSVGLIQAGEPQPADAFCEWMPYQKGQAVRQDPAPTQHRQSSHRENLELSVAHAMADRVAERGGSGAETGSQVRRAIDALLDTASAAAPQIVGIPVRDDHRDEGQGQAAHAVDAVFAARGQRSVLDFGAALRALKHGERVARLGWNGKDMWLALSCDGSREVPAAGFWSPANRKWAEQQPNGTAVVLPSITMKTATGEILMGWLASQTDMLAEDWVVVA